ncbi:MULTISPECIES: winged helix-turn-helix domain-containing protein [Brevibacillus]|uniref:Helix-turn-helix domain-containing protein n=2 Tax=Brevibacillus TaxID=55080 RepID=A0A1I3XU71_9BACL|nr:MULTISPECIES: helix-turn-helix domain-containing protein [Brevibacillus]MEC2128766.1 helix-turn-helix domain-containing protein [Brevibacillus centrosporus]MED1795626.1 helix-turn-helix domain-containing protein [Brevibacillus nitrificans]MED4910405.1 helix-turn-helix domain-containing protein [Brevibacillus centrosporus]RNB71370.1 ArsR family transcriptional regulator [Brevibacillus centrosporus]RNB81396.1 ArsR family transcriptional regulator [Brevibacillus nitrificans]
MAHEQLETYVVESPEQAMALLNPLRAEILSRLTEPASAAEVARGINEIPQRVNYHLKALEKVGLVRKVGSRQVRNLVEVLYLAIARTYVLSEALNWASDTVQQMKDQGALSHLVNTAERIKRDALALMERSDQEEQIPSATLDASIRLASAEQRSAFVEEYVQLVNQLVKKYQTQAQGQETYQVILAVYPKEGGTES